jgi:hypothetical protein
MLPKEEWKLLVRLCNSAKENTDGIINFTAGDFNNVDDIEARNRLMERGFITYADRQTNLSGQNILEINDLPYLRINVSGKDTALLYSNWFKRSGLWFNDWKYHWIIGVISFFMGIVVTITMPIICRYFRIK